MSRRDYITHRENARWRIHERLAYFAAAYAALGHALSYRRVAVRDQRSRWGSCSRAGNLNFNYRIIHLRPELADYIVVHELCHTKEFSHAPAFWLLVALTVPDWKRLRAELRKIRVQ